METFNKYQVGDYNFIYYDSFDKDFNSLGYDEKDLVQVSQELLAYLKNTPPKLKGNFIKESGGAVKARVTKSKSSRGREDRLIYTLVSPKNFILIQLYTKSKKEDLSRTELKEISESISKYRIIFGQKIIGAAASAINLKGPDWVKMRNSMLSAEFEDSFEFINEVITLD